MKPFDFEETIDPRRLEQAIAVSKQAFLAEERGRAVSRLEFLCQQSRYVKKSWWLLQGALLAAVCLVLRGLETDDTVRRCLGLAGPLLAVLVLPELWKNRSADAMEVECTTVFSLRAIYAARLVLFAGVDLLLLSAFFAGAAVLTRVTVWEMLTQFLLPFNVTCIICLVSLYSHKIRSQSLSMALCLTWAALWLLVVKNDTLYNAISAPVWAAALAASFLCLGGILLRGQRKWKTEVVPAWN